MSAGTQPAAGTVSVLASGAARAAVDAHVAALVEDRVASRLAARDATLWGEAAEPEASIRLGWVDLHERSQPVVARADELAGALRAEALDRVVLCGMGGSSLAPEVITATAGVDLVVLDGTDPDQVARVVGEDLGRTVVVVSSKSGSTVETDSQRRAFEAAFTQAGIDPAARIVVVTDPGSPLQASATEAGYTVLTADPEVGGRYSALTAFGLVPSCLAGADVGALVAEAAAVAPSLAQDSPDNPALVLGAALAGTDPLRDKIVLVDDGSGLPGFGDWAEQLVAESTGKDGTGLLPVVVGADAPEVKDPPADALVVRLSAAGGGQGDGGQRDGGDEVRVSGPLGAQMLLWEAATAVAGRLLGINPFDQPDVESAKTAARGMLDDAPEPQPPAFTVDGVEVRATPGLLDDGAGDATEDLDGALDALLGELDGERGYLAVMAYLDREAHADLAGARDALAARTGRPVTFGWGPRFLHSTGQFHKGGPANGVFLQVTAEPTQDVDIPGRPFGFGRLVAAQAAGDASVLAEHGRPVLRLHLRDRGAALERVLALLTASPGTGTAP